MFSSKRHIFWIDCKISFYMEFRNCKRSSKTIVKNTLYTGSKWIISGYLISDSDSVPESFENRRQVKLPVSESCKSSISWTQRYPTDPIIRRFLVGLVHRMNHFQISYSDFRIRIVQKSEALKTDLIRIIQLSEEFPSDLIYRRHISSLCCST